MIQTIKIENVALISSATLNFTNLLNVISGETGAGKSIMLDALSFVFGGRADKSLIRSGESKMRVEAIFTNLTQKQKDFVLNELNIDVADELFLFRELDLSGKNICKINGELVPVNMVKKICLMLVDIHGQSEHLAILNNDYQLQIIDLFSKTASGVLQKIAGKIDQIKSVESQIKLLGGNESEKQNLIDLYSYQINEIKNANIGATEYEDLLAEKKEMQQFEHINNALKISYEAGERNSFNPSAMENINASLKALQSISDINGHYQELYNRLNSLSIELADINQTIYNDLNNNVFDEQRFNYIDQRLDYIKSLFRKYGGSYASMNEYLNTTCQKLDNLTNSAQKYAELNETKAKLIEQTQALQQSLTKIRLDSAKKLCARIGEELKFLGMPAARMDVEFSTISEPYSYTGADRVEFMFSSNLGFELKPLNKVVSGGEMSRVMLAYKIVVGEVDDISTIIFDEVDSGLSGEIASVVAKYLARLSINKQIIAISHLPQICAMADNNIKVYKLANGKTTNTFTEQLTGEKLLTEIARLMGAEANEKGLVVSADLKQKSSAYKQSLNK